MNNTEKTAATPQGAGKSYTVGELLTLMGPEFQRQKDVMRQCIAGLTEYAAQLAVRGHEDQLPRLRMVCIEMAEFWGLAEDDTPEGARNMAEQYGSAFDHAVSTARGTGCAPGLGEQAVQNTLAGLELYARELRANDEGLEDWAVECEILADDLEEFAARSGPEELEVAEQHEGAPAKASSSFRGERRGKEAQCGIPEGCSTWSGLCPDDAGPGMGMSP